MKRALIILSLLALCWIPQLAIPKAAFLAKPEYSLHFGQGNSSGLSPADATTYHFGDNLAINGSTTTDGGHRVCSPVTGTVKRVYGAALINGTAGSSENVTITVRNVTAATTENVTTTAVWNVGSKSEVSFSNTAMTLAVTAGDCLIMRIVTPTWVTNPTGVYIYATAVLK